MHGRLLVHPFDAPALAENHNTLGQKRKRLAVARIAVANALGFFGVFAKQILKKEHRCGKKCHGAEHEDNERRLGACHVPNDGRAKEECDEPCTDNAGAKPNVRETLVGSRIAWREPG